jgi:hypothetical protein
MGRMSWWSPSDERGRANQPARAFARTGRHCLVGARRPLDQRRAAAQRRRPRLRLTGSDELLMVSENARPQPMAFDPPISLETCRSSGEAFGQARAGLARESFEVELTVQLVTLQDALRSTELDHEQALATFDHAAWSAWERLEED